jgi:endonuclease/exonuclease/phosphatase (EEP) superfamily protein YafD
MLVYACCLHAAVVLSIALLNVLGPERWWWAGANMFLPQWIWGAPSLALLPLSLAYARRWMWLPAATVLLVAGPLMGFSWSAQRAAEGVPLRVMTYNVQLWQSQNVAEVVAEIQAAHPDILFLQDARAGGRTVVDNFVSDWNVASFGQYVIASKFPIVDSAPGDISYDGETHTYLHARINVAGQIVFVSTAHFATPRDALSGYRSPRFWAGAAPLIKENLSHRMLQARKLADDLRHVQEPLIVAGDLNSPPPSLVIRTLTDLGLTDAFSAGGRGYGYTFGHTLLYGESFLRLDHILVSRHFTTAASSVGGTSGSDHRPVVADVVLRKGSGVKGSSR